MATEDEWNACKAAFSPGFIAETGGMKLMVVSHYDFQEEFWVGLSRVAGMRARNLDTGADVNWPAKDWISLWKNMRQTLKQNGKTNGSHEESDSNNGVRGPLEEEVPNRG